MFAVNTNGTYFTNLYNFTGGSDGAKPAGELVLFSNILIGTASSGGDTSLNNGGNGTVFGLNTNGTDFTVLYRFTAGNYDYSLIDGGALTNSDGANPQAGLVLSGDTLYGTTSLGGSGGNGTVFSLITGATADNPQRDAIGDKSGDQWRQWPIGRNKCDVDELGSHSAVKPVDAGGDQRPGRDRRFHLHRHQRGGSPGTATVLYPPNPMRICFIILGLGVIQVNAFNVSIIVSIECSRPG